MANCVSMNQNQCLLFIHLKEKANVVLYPPMATVWNYPDQIDAERLAILLKNIGVLDQYNETKRAWQFMNGSRGYNITLRREHFEKIADTYEKYYINFIEYRKRDNGFDDEAQATAAWQAADAESIQVAIVEVDKEITKNKLDTAN